MNILVLMGGMSAERDISLNTGKAVAEALESIGRRITVFDLDPSSGRDVYALVAAPELRESDVVWIALHGGEGEDGRIQALLDLLGIPYTGSGARSSAVCMDKAISKTLLESAGIITPEWLHPADRGRDIRRIRDWIGDIGGPPVVVKPVDQGSTIGVTILESVEGLPAAIDLALAYSSGLILERYIEGKELSVAIVGDEVFPIVEIKPNEGFYDYKRKYTKGLTSYDCPAVLDDALARRIRQEAVGAYRVLECEGFGRVDLRLAPDGTPYFLEVNTIPGMTETSLVPMAAKANGISFPELVDRIASLALETRERANQKAGG